MDRRAVYGPRDGTVLSQQSQHRSDEILDGDIDEVLQAKRADGKFWRNLREQDLPIRVQQILHQIGFYGVYRCGRIQYDCHLITALVEMWRSETHSFHFRVGEATITLQDVQVIWGLPIDGEPVSGTDLERTSVQWQEYCMQYIGFAPEEGALKGSRLQIWAWSRIIPLCPGLGAPRVHMGPHQIDNNRVLPGAPYGAMWNCEHTFTRTVRTTVRVIRDILDEMQYDQIGFCSTSSTSLDGKDDMTRSYKDNPFPTEEIQIEDIGNGINNITRHFVSSSTNRRVESGYQPGDAPMLQIVLNVVIWVDIAGPSTAYTPQDYYVPQPPQDYYVPQPSQDDWFQSTSYMPSHAEAYSSHVDLDLGLGINQPYAPEYNISPVPFPSFSAYRDNMESSSAASSSGFAY
ncbi:UNVERIFIED_CONTAM: Serine/threonine-protein phosphatase 7 long form [Sesamum radiatum]|uniref:Serine/threonine-protein phosphatase 7 long form n=1 Tax=Sesamum radiatum TaxID=300843 RepID=A0AAW2UNZ7_SESRA